MVSPCLRQGRLTSLRLGDGSCIGRRGERGEWESDHCSELGNECRSMVVRLLDPRRIHTTESFGGWCRPLLDQLHFRLGSREVELRASSLIISRAPLSTACATGRPSFSMRSPSLTPTSSEQRLPSRRSSRPSSLSGNGRRIGGRSSSPRRARSLGSHSFSSGSLVLLAAIRRLE